MNNKKGFTLIELLAVIVILAIIAVITVPKVTELINSSRKGAAEDAFYGTLKAAELGWAKTLTKNVDLSESDCTFEKNETTNKTEVTCTNGVSISIGGASPESGVIHISSKGTAKVNSHPLLFNGYKCIGDLSKAVCYKGDEELLAADMLKTKTVTEGEGLYEDLYEDNKYIFRGVSVNNYIKFNNELWRILSINSDNTIKIIKDVSIGKFPWDEATSTTSGPRLNENNTYCVIRPDKNAYEGCNVWSKVDGNVVHETSKEGGSYATADNLTTGTVTIDASLNTYLNGEYYNNLSADDKKHMVKRTFNVGFPTDHLTISQIITREKQFTWDGYVGLINASEYLRLSLNEECNNIYNSYTYETCTDNYIYQSMVENDETSAWTINGGRNRWHVFTIFNSDEYKGGLPAEPTYKSIEVRPVVYLKKEIKLKGEGTKDNPYVFVS